VPALVALQAGASSDEAAFPILHSMIATNEPGQRLREARTRRDFVGAVVGEMAARRISVVLAGVPRAFRSGLHAMSRSAGLLV